MDVAETHLGGAGYLGVSPAEVASEVGVSKPALYYLFPRGKDEFFVALPTPPLRITARASRPQWRPTRPGRTSCARWLAGL
jgi:hypothetical protein